MAYWASIGGFYFNGIDIVVPGRRLTVHFALSIAATSLIEYSNVNQPTK